MASESPTYGTPGPDVIVGGSVGYTIYAGGGNDLVCAGRGPDWVQGGLGADRLAGGRAADVLFGGRGSDRLLGGRDYDSLWGGRGDDVFFPGGESAQVMFFVAPAPVTVNLITNTATGEGTDTVNDGIDAVYGSDYGDTLIGESDTKELYGGLGNDTLSIQVPGRAADVYGEEGDDTLRVDDREGLDRVYGGDGRDECFADPGDTVSGCPLMTHH